MNFESLSFYLILCARLRLARGVELGRSVLNKSSLWHSNYHFLFFYFIELTLI